MSAFKIRFGMSMMPALLASIVLLGSSCSKSSNETQATNETPPASTAPAITDAEIAAVVVTANQADIENAQQAQTKSANSEIKAFANMMVTDHGSVNDKANALATQLSLVPQESETSRTIKSSQDAMRESLKDKSGSAFDKAYINNEVTYHEMVLNAMDQTLIPNAQDAQLKQLLTDTRPAIEQHLQHARELQTKIGALANR